MKKIRCAIYTRKSAEEGLEQEFNSLDAQREACAAYVASQKAESWVLLPTVYEDAGLSGGTLERPGLQRLLADIDAGLVDQIVVYKVDRLTRSLSDFAKLVDRLDAASTGFVSVTQSFNTATSMGRLTLHMLLSFAQFEREVTAERIRDKVAASKRKGLWMGGRVPLGYEKDERTLRINEAEAETVRTLYALYRKHGTLRQVKAEADRLGLRTKQRFAADGTRTGGLPFRRGHLHCLLTNPLYAGRIRHQRRVYEGQHPSIIAPELWDAVQTQLQAGAAKPRRRTTKGRAARSPLAGKLFDETGDRLTPSHTKKKNGQRLRYYVSRRLIQHSGQKDLSGWRLPAPMLEQTIVHLIRQHVDATTFSASLIHTPTMQELASVRRFLDGLCSGSKPIHLMIDSTGLRIHVGTARKPPKQRAWRKLHIAVDRETGNIVASELTASRARDATRVPALLTQIQAPLASVAADSAYDKEAVYEAIEAHSPGRRTRVVIPPQRNATLNQNSNTAMQERDRHIRAIERHGRREWYKLSGCTKRSMVENAVYRYKAIIGPEMRTRTLARQRVEHRIGCEILNKMTALGMPDAYCAG